MKFAQDSQDDGYVITAYDSDSIAINGKTFRQSLIIAPTRLHQDWEADTIGQLQQPHIDTVLSFEPELIIIGTGNKLVFPAVEIYSEIIRRGIGVDFMDTGAACRTYNILMSEGRNVVAGIIISE
ncbi:MAG: Mth938-like domain-containing protein [Proteobacteria bacterium]|nr:Mth938-like domain-containing protein [Pseudomonadota bacterium]